MKVVTKTNSSQELLEGEMQYLQEEISGLAEDVIDLDEEQSRMIDDINRLVVILDKSAEIHKNTVETLSIHQKELTALSESLDKTDSAWTSWIIGILVWLIILTGGVVYNVFF